MKVKIDSIDMSIIINCLHQMESQYSPDVQDKIDIMILSLIKIYDHMKPGRRKRIHLTAAEHHIIIQCLNDWRNLFLSAGENAKAEAIGETLLAFC